MTPCSPNPVVSYSPGEQVTTPPVMVSEVPPEWKSTAVVSPSAEVTVACRSCRRF
jgi:hypothetical protein